MNSIKLLLLLALFSLQSTQAMLTSSLPRVWSQAPQLVRGAGAAREALPGLTRTMGQQASRFSQPSTVQRFMHAPYQSPTMFGRVPSWTGAQTPAAHGFWRSVGDRMRGLMQSHTTMPVRDISIPKGDTTFGWGARAAALAAIAGYGAAKSLESHDRAQASEEMDTEETAAVEKIGNEIWDNLRNSQTVQAIIDKIPAGLEGSVAVKIADYLLGYINNYPGTLSNVMYWFPGTVDTLTKFLVTYPQDLANRVPEVAKLVDYLLKNGSANAKLILQQSIDDNQEVIVNTSYGKQVLEISGLVPQLRVSLNEAAEAVDNAISNFATSSSRLME